MIPPDGTIFCFDGFELDMRLHEVRLHGKRQHVEPQVFDVLSYLLANRDRLVTKDELLDNVWGHRYVAPTTLTSRIKHARQAVGDDGDAQRVIRTVHGVGFRVVVEVEERPSSATADSPAAAANVATPEQRIRFCTARDGVRIACAASGTGPPIVKPPNWMTHLEYDWESPVWRHWLGALSREHTLVRFDQRGNGLSDRDAEDLSFEAWVRDLETVVDTLGLERFPLLALSQGCAVAVAYAARHPERVSKLVLYGGYTQGILTSARTQAEREERELILRGVPLGWGHDNLAFRLYFAGRFIPEGTLEQMHWFCDLQRTTTAPNVASRLLSTAAQIDVGTLAPKVRAPTLVLHATGDAAVPFDEGRKLASAIPDARFVPLDGRNHILLEHEPAWARFVDEVSRFLADGTAVKAATSSPPRRSARQPKRRSG